MEIRFTQAFLKHRVGRSSARYVTARTTPAGTTTSQGNPGWRYVGPDERGRDLEIIAVEITGNIGQDRPACEEVAQMPSPNPFHITDHTPIGRDINLEQDDVRLQDGTRLSDQVADDIVEQVRRTAGRPSLSGQAAASPQISFRVAPAVRDRAAEVAAKEGKTVSELAREALEDRLTASR